MQHQLLLPEIQAAINSLEACVARAEKEIEELTETRKQKKAQNRDWKKALKALNGRQGHQDHFRLDFLPPYSPDLNPIECVWKFTPRQCLHSRYFSTLEELIKTVENRFAEWEYGNSTLRRLCALT